MRKQKRLTNEQFVASLMNSNKVGLMSTLVVLAAIDNYTRRVAALTPAELLESFPENGLICGESWKRACEEIQEKFAARTSEAR